jgi:hypothetical protein
MQQFFDALTRPGGEGVMVITIILLFCLTVVTTVALVQWRKLRQAEQIAVLMQEMVRRGMSAGEILQLLAASRGSKSKPGQAGSVGLPEAAESKARDAAERVGGANSPAGLAQTAEYRG